MEKKIIPIFFRKAYSQIKSKLKKIIGYKVIYNANKVNEADYNKRAILIYIVQPFLLEEDDPVFFNHQNLKQCKQVVTILGECGYIVDVVDIEDIYFRPSQDYDLVISHRINLDGLEELFKQNSIKVYLSTGMNHIIHNKNMMRRYHNLITRKNFHIKPPTLNSENMSFVFKSDAIIGFGNQYIMETWGKIFKGNKYSFDNYGFETTKFINKDFVYTRKNFLFFASINQILKGLDLLLEIFPKYPDLNLYICSNFEKEYEFCKCYYKELYKTKNIFPIGIIKVNSNKFYELIQKCAYIILPTCSEGQPGSVIQCMYAGLIPIVTKEAGIDTEDFGITLTNDTIDEIEKTIINLSQMPVRWCKEKSIKTRKIAEQKYSEEAFINRWKEIIQDIISPEFDS